MIATISMEKSNWEETISTCKFSQRVALIKNTVSVNTFVDDKVVIKHLKQENYKIKNELNELREEKNQIVELEEDHFVKCVDVIKILLKKDEETKDIIKTIPYSKEWVNYEDKTINEIANEPLMAIACFNLFKKIVEEKNKIIEKNKNMNLIKMQNHEIVNNKVDNLRDLELNKKKIENPIKNNSIIKRNNFLEPEQSIQKEEIKDRVIQKENINNQNIKEKKEIKQKPVIHEKIEINESIKDNRKVCLEIFKKNPKFIKRFEGLKDDKALLEKNIELGKKGSKVKQKIKLIPRK
jgi:kinesin family protein 6/9